MSDDYYSEMNPEEPMSRLEKITAGIACGLLIGGVGIGALCAYNHRPDLGAGMVSTGAIAGLGLMTFVNAYASRSEDDI